MSRSTHSSSDAFRSSSSFTFSASRLSSSIFAFAAFFSSAESPLMKSGNASMILPLKPEPSSPPDSPLILVRCFFRSCRCDCSFSRSSVRSDSRYVFRSPSTSFRCSERKEAHSSTLVCVSMHANSHSFCSTSASVCSTRSLASARTARESSPNSGIQSFHPEVSLSSIEAVQSFLVLLKRREFLLQSVLLFTEILYIFRSPQLGREERPKPAELRSPERNR